MPPRKTLPSDNPSPRCGHRGFRRRATQVTRVEEFVTFCAWSGRVRWKDEWVSVEIFLSERYNLNISHGIWGDSKRRILTDAGLAIPARLSGRDPGGAEG
jgi:hypothetical protein